MPEPRDWFTRAFDGFAKGFGSAVEDIRRNVLETGWFGKAVTGRATTITIGSPGEQSPGERLGWFQRSFTPESQGSERGQDAREPAREPSHGWER